MCSQTLKKFEKITEGNRFKFLYSRGKKLVLPSLIVYIYVDSRVPGRRLGVTVSKKMGKSVVRNRAKRLLRELFRKNKFLFPEHAEVVMVARHGLVEKSYSELEKELHDGLQSLEISSDQNINK
ncbi:MAG TPA: ribonuclease P protein component [Candidatus Limnocylindrales bacterium]|nr:ribonuclease P protein component [Candidatus Limnocylindrales bacterium]